VGEIVYDFEENDFVQPIRDFYDDLWENDILILNRIEIFPEYRGMGIGKHLIKDLYNNFIQGCALFVLKCFPLQAEAGTLDRHKEHAIKMGYLDFEKDKAKSFKKLHSYYKSIGFLNIPSISKEYMFMNPIVKNKKFQSIVLE
jgi:GNAT superfamily N-acetyltransferase